MRSGRALAIAIEGALSGCNKTYNHVYGQDHISLVESSLKGILYKFNQLANDRTQPSVDMALQDISSPLDST